MADVTAAQPRPRWGRLAALLALFAAAYVPVALFVADHEGALYDDAFIYFRYADNLLAGCGFAYNCGQAPVEGFTSGLYLALLTALHALGLPLADAATAIGQFGTWSAALLAAGLAAALLHGRHPGLRWAAAVATLIALGSDGFWLLNAVTGLETALAAALCTVVALAMVRLRAGGGSARGLGWAIWLAWLARPEAAVFGPAALLWPLGRDAPGEGTRTNRGVATRIFVSLALLVGAVLAARWTIFGDWVANTARAKSGGSAAHIALGWAYLQECGRDFPLLLVAPLALLAPSLRRLLAPFLAASAVWVLATLATGGDHFAYGRMLAPLLPSLTAVAVATVAVALERALARRAAAVVPVAVLLLASTAWGVQTASRHAVPALHGFPNVTRWLQVGAWLREHRPGASVATVPIGAIGWASGAPLIDLVGLTEPAIARFGRALPPERLTRSWIGHERERTEWVLAQRPELLVFTRSAQQPFALAQARAGFWAEWLILREIKEGRAPYRLLQAEVAEGVFWLVFERVPL